MIRIIDYSIINDKDSNRTSKLIKNKNHICPFFRHFSKDEEKRTKKRPNKQKQLISLKI